MTYDFTPFYTLVDKQGEPLYNKALPLFERLVSHLVYIFFWLTLILTTHFLLPTTLYTDYLFMGLIFVHLFLFGCRLTTLLLYGGLFPILFPPLPIRLTRKLQRNPSLSLLEKHNLHTHPGLLTNLALIQHANNNPACRTTLALALSYSSHPTLLHLQTLLT